MDQSNEPRHSTDDQLPDVDSLLQDQLRVLFHSPLGLALREYLYELLQEEIDRLHATGSRASAHTAGGVMSAQRIVLPEKPDDWGAGETT